jgi:hypothetical protein
LRTTFHNLLARLCAGAMFTRTSFICGYGKRGLGVAAGCGFVSDFVATEGRRQGLGRMGDPAGVAQRPSVRLPCLEQSTEQGLDMCLFAKRVERGPFHLRTREGR